MNNLNKLTNQSIADTEKEIQAFWKENTIFEKSLKQREGATPFSFPDGPPFPSGSIHYGHLWTTAAKDMIPRYQTMRGKYVRRVWGWDCHGLSVENAVNKANKIGSTEYIRNTIGVKKYVSMCREYVNSCIGDWEWYVDRIGRWTDMKNAYRTMDLPFQESVVWGFRQLWDKGLVYEGKSVQLYSTDSGTPVSPFEVAMDPDNYIDTEDTTVFVKFKLKNENAFVLAWTTTPWTLFSNFALAINQNETYDFVKVGEETFVVASKLKEKLELVNNEVIKSVSGKELVGLDYEPLFQLKNHQNEKDYKIYHGDFVSMEDGTGVVHIAPAFGADDNKLGKENGLSDWSCIDDLGKLKLVELESDSVTAKAEGVYIRDAMEIIAYEMFAEKKVWKIQKYTHALPYYKGKNPLIYVACPGWFVNIQKLKPRMIELIEKTNWVPAHLQQGRWKNIIETAPDWGLSRDRFWHTVLPIWKSESGKMIVPGSVNELMTYTDKITLRDNKYFIVDDGIEQEFSFHRDVCDDLVLTKDGEEYRRVEQVMDAWMDSGSVPFAEYHYPFENKELFENSFPVDFIVEYIGQTRAWFNVVYRLAVGIFDTFAFKNVICHGVLSGTDGRKMSKTFGNYPDPKETLDKSADGLRLYMLSSSLLTGDDVDFDELQLSNQTRNILLPLINTLKYYTIYRGSGEFEIENAELMLTSSDEWIITRLQQLINLNIENLDKFIIPDAVRGVEGFVEDLSTWYVRTNRDRFVAGDQSALFTLYKVLKNLSKVLAPIAPYVSEKMWQVLRLEDENISVHLEDYPEYLELTPDQTKLIERMKLIREVCAKILAVRDSSKIAIKQVLSKVNVVGILLADWEKEVIKNEVNVMNVYNDGVFDGGIEVLLDTEITRELRVLGLFREITSIIQSERKKADIKLEDEIELSYNGSELVLECIEQHKVELMKKLRISKLEKMEGLNGKKQFGEDLLEYEIRYAGL